MCYTTVDDYSILKNKFHEILTIFCLGVEGCFGGYMCMNLGLYSYTADSSSDENRTWRMSFLTGIIDLKSCKITRDLNPLEYLVYMIYVFKCSNRRSGLMIALNFFFQNEND